MRSTAILLLNCIGFALLPNQWALPVSAQSVSAQTVSAQTVSAKRELSDAGPAQATDASALPVCIGFNPETENWGQFGSGHPRASEGNCPRGWAFLGASYVSGVRRPGRNVPVQGTCCKLPDGLLTEEHVDVLEDCPTGFIATGARPSRVMSEAECRNNDAECTAIWRKTDQFMRCTRINMARFQLGAQERGIGIGWGRHFSSMFHARTAWTAIPASLRYGLARRSKDEWTDGACLGYPWGSPLVAKRAKYCNGFFFAQLQYTGATGDPPAGTPVVIVPPCRRINSPWDPNAKCID